MKHIILGVSLLILSWQSFAEQPLSKPLLEQYVSTIEKFQGLEEKYPAMGAEFENLLQMTPDAVMKKIKGMPAYNEIENIVKAAGYDSFEQFYQQSYRIMSSMFAVQMQQIPDSVESMSEMLNSTVERMKKSGMPSEMISKMEKEMAAQKANIDSMATLAKSASNEDIAFMKENMMWLMSIMPNGIGANQ